MIMEYDDDKPSEDVANDEGFLDKVLSVQTEEDIFQEATKTIENIVKGNLRGHEETMKLHNNEINEPTAMDLMKQVELQKQVKLGEITPFEAVTQHSDSQKVKGLFDKTSHLLDIEKYLKQQAELAAHRKQLKTTSKRSNDKKDQPLPIKKLKLSSLNLKSCKGTEKAKCKNYKRKTFPETDRTKGLTEIDYSNDFNTEHRTLNIIDELHVNHTHLKNASACFASSEVMTLTNDSGSEYYPSAEEAESEDETEPSSKKKKKVNIKSSGNCTKRILDDGDEKLYKQRVEEHGYPKVEPLHKIDNLFKVPQSIWNKLYRYQRVSVQWLWELHGRNLGGLLGDEMGLGKTVQVLAFLAGLDCSELLSDGGRFRGLGPTLIVCPATLMEQWVKHFHEWWPILRIVILHRSGTYCGEVEDLLYSLKAGGVLVTSYSGMLMHKDLLVKHQWHYVILDEGHKIRNPQAKVSNAVKEFSTPHRLLLTGSPMQNSLNELWSLFDFILPGKLGTLPAFLEHCANPITRGGYANATPLQEATALQVATMLKDAITPYMLRRTKNDVQHHVSLPEKNEQILFCGLTSEQKKLYKKYLRSEDVSFILHEQTKLTDSKRHRARLLIALTALRKICNHPDLFLCASQMDSDEDIDMSEEFLKNFGYWKRAGKMTVVRSLLKIWKKQGHRVLLFTQGRQMMHILESLIQSEEYEYLRMDGTTPMSERQRTIRLYNDNPSYFVFLLTTRVGGLGVNLTGANRVVIYDPDWNPATDAQARERAWRIGQNKSVTIYRLITAGTIEEKIYHRQVFKVLLSNKVLEDPRQRRLFKTSDIAELFNLNEPIDRGTSESDQLFRESRLTPMATKFSSSKVEEMRKLAATLSKNIRTCTSVSAHSTETASELKKTNTAIKDSGNQDRSNGDNIAQVKLSQSGTVDATLPHCETQNNARAASSMKRKVNDTNWTLLESDSEVCDVEITSGTNERSFEYSTSAADSNTSEITCKNTELVSSTKHENAVANLSTTHRKHKQIKSRKKSRSEKEHVSAIFEGEQIPCLIGRRLGHSQVMESTQHDDDQYVLRKLFAKASNDAVSSAFQHEKVLSNTRCDVDARNPMQVLARETAQENMDNVRKSRKWCWKPTWGSPHSESGS